MTGTTDPSDREGLAAYRLTVSYLGTRFAGWQRQPNAPTVQETLESALARLTGETTKVLGAGRTDAGVHARGQVAAVALSRPWEPRALVHGTNHHLPADVRVLAVEPVATTFHPQRDALGKEYRYRLVPAPVLDPLAAPTSVRVGPECDLATIRHATRHLVGRHDFGAFAKTGGSHDDPVRTILAAGWADGEGAWTLRILGDGFLRGMVRAIVGTLVEVGRGRRDPRDLARLVRGEPRAAAGPNAPAEGLVLQEVFYREDALRTARATIEDLS